MKVFTNRIKRYLIIFILLIVLISSFGFSANADYYNANNGMGNQTTPTAYQTTKIFSSYGDIGSLLNPSDLFIDLNDLIYILDAGNSRVIKLDQDGKVLNVFKGEYGKEKKYLNNPKGIFVDKGGDIFIADTENNRVVHLGATGNYIEEFIKPTEETYDSSIPFKPQKIYLDNLGRIYIANTFDYHGLITLDGDNKFIGYIAATKIGFNFVDSIVRTFATKEQKEQLAREVPPYFSNFLIADDGFIYATSLWDKENQIKKLTVSGNNVYPQKVYGQFNNNKDFSGRPAFVDLAVSKSGIVFAADKVLNKIFVYDQEGNNIVTFGDSGSRKRTFNSIAAIGINSKNQLLVLDDVLNSIQILTPTQIMGYVIEAVTLYNNGEYESAVTPWEKVLKLDNTHTFASTGIAKAEYRNGDMVKSLQMYKDAKDKKGYSDAFYEYRLSVIRNNFNLILIFSLLVVFLLYFSVIRLYKYVNQLSEQTISFDKQKGIKDYLKLFLLILFHPLDAFEKIKQHRKNLKIWPLISVMLLLVIIRIVNIYIVHFPFMSVDINNVDIWQQVATFLLPLGSWILINFAISTIQDGKQTVKETLTASLFSFVPYIIFTIPISLLSNLLCLKEALLYNSLNLIVMVWCVVLLLMSEKVLNEYSFKKFSFVVIETVFGILCFWMIAFLFYIVVFQFINLIKEIYFEASMLGLKK